MFAKLLITVLFATAIGAALLGLRQQRMENMHEITRLHNQMDQLRRQTWDLQVRIAAGITPQALEQAVDRGDWLMEPTVVPSPGPAQQQHRRVTYMDQNRDRYDRQPIQ
jgi:hypothetical protein